MTTGATCTPARSVGISTSATLCSEHGLPLNYICKQCNVTICGECTALGRHHKHEPVVAVRDNAQELKDRVRQKTAVLRNSRLPDVQQSLAAVQNVLGEFSSNADFVRAKIRSSAQSVKDIVDLVMQQKLTEVDDLEETRLKHLHKQEDDLKQLENNLKSVISYGEKVLDKEGETDEVCDALFRVEKRVGELDEVRLVDRPVEHPRVDFKGISEETLMAKVNQLVGVVFPCPASATHSFIQGEMVMECIQGSSVSFVVVAKDDNGHSLATGGDVIRVESQQMSSSENRSSSVDVVGNENGTYTITAHQGGHHSFDVFINNVKLEQCLSVNCCSLSFDPAECQSGIRVSEDTLTVTDTGGGWSSVLSTQGMSTGEHVWKVKVTKKTKIFLGKAEKPELTAKPDNYDSTYSWYGATGQMDIMGEWRTSMEKWQENDVLQLNLSCSEHTLSLTNLRSGEMATVTNLPQTELFAFFATGGIGISLTLIP